MGEFGNGEGDDNNDNGGSGGGNGGGGGGESSGGGGGGDNDGAGASGLPSSGAVPAAAEVVEVEALRPLCAGERVRHALHRHEPPCLDHPVVRRCRLTL